MTNNQPIPSTPQGESNANDDATHPDSNAVPEVKVPPSHKSYAVTCNKKRDKWDIAKLVAEFIGLGFLIAYTLYTAGIYCANRKAANAAKSSADSTAKELELQNRPWVYADLEIAGPFVFDEQGASTQVKLTYRNDGHSPATIRKMDPELYIGQKRGTVYEERRKFCNENSIWQGPKEGITIIPTAKTDAITWPVSVPIDEIKEAVAKSLTPGLIGVHVIVCVVYDSTFNDTQHPYYTDTSYQLISIGPDKKGRAGFKFGDTLPVGKFDINRFTAATAIR